MTEICSLWSAWEPKIDCKRFCIHWFGFLADIFRLAVCVPRQWLLNLLNSMGWQISVWLPKYTQMCSNVRSFELRIFNVHCRQIIRMYNVHHWNVQTQNGFSKCVCVVFFVVGVFVSLWIFGSVRILFAYDKVDLIDWATKSTSNPDSEHSLSFH